MPLEPFFNHFPEIGKQETRSLNIVGGAQDGVPEGQYAFVEFYCTERGCDCRRVILQVAKLDEGVVASVSFGFDRKAPMAGPYLDPLLKQAPYAAALLKLTEKLLLSDPAYVARLERHYQMLKAQTDPPAARDRWWKKPKRRRRP